MKTYRAYILTSEGNVLHAIDLVCATEADAIARAEQLVHEYPIEVWDGARRIARFEPRER